MKNLLLTNILFTEMGKSENKIGIIGGTFDPVHMGHLIIAEKAREEFGLEKVFFIPAGVPPHKKQFFASSGQRLEMINLAIENNAFFDSLPIEIKNTSEPSYTYRTVSELERLYPGFKICLIVGEDAFFDLPTWRKYELLIKKTTFLVARRKADKPYKSLPDGKNIRYAFIASPLIEISSSYIRDCFLKRETVKYLLPEKVILYIRRNNLYGLEGVKRKN